MRKTQQQMAVTTLENLSFKEIGLHATISTKVNRSLASNDNGDLPFLPQAVIRHQKNLLVFMILGLSIYIFVLDFLVRLDTRSGVLLNATFLFILGLVGYQLIVKSPYPKWVHGLHLKNWQSAVKEAISWSLGFIGVAIALKAWLITFIPAFQELPLLSLNVFYNSGWSDVLVAIVLYSIFVPFQELLCRGLVQGTFQQTLVGRYAKITAILLTTILFAACHIITSPMLAYTAIIPSIFWGILYARNSSLLAVSVSHVILGNFFLLFEYLPISDLGNF